MGVFCLQAESFKDAIDRAEWQWQLDPSVSHSTRHPYKSHDFNFVCFLPSGVPRWSRQDVLVNTCLHALKHCAPDTEHSGRKPV